MIFRKRSRPAANADHAELIYEVLEEREGYVVMMNNKTWFTVTDGVPSFTKNAAEAEVFDSLAEAQDVERMCHGRIALRMTVTYIAE